MHYIKNTNDLKIYFLTVKTHKIKKGYFLITISSYLGIKLQKIFVFNF
jgi:hypothetical protein